MMHLVVLFALQMADYFACKTFEGPKAIYTTEGIHCLGLYSSDLLYSSEALVDVHDLSCLISKSCCSHEAL